MKGPQFCSVGPSQGGGFFGPPSEVQSVAPANVNVLGGTPDPSTIGVAVGRMQHAFPGMLPSRPKLLEKRRGWKTFAMKWKQYMEAFSGFFREGPPPDIYVLRELEQCVDVEDQKSLKDMRSRNTMMSSKEFYSFLEDEYGVQQTEQARNAWEALPFPSSEVNQDKWGMFRVEFRAIRNAVEGGQQEMKG